MCTVDCAECASRRIGWRGAGQCARMSSVLVLRDSVEESGSVSAVAENVEYRNLGEIENGDAGLAESQFNLVRVYTSSSVPSAVAGEILRVLKPDGTVEVQVDGVSGSQRKVFVFAGFTDVHEILDSNDVRISAKKATWQSSDVAPVSLSTSKINSNTSSTKDVWNLGVDDLADGEVELEDEDDLLAHETFQVSIEKNSSSDCAPSTSGGKKKACKNCTCGRAEEEAAAERGQAVSEQPKASACGSCYLGDAFRCSSCPYLGMPAFKPGDKVKLDL